MPYMAIYIWQEIEFPKKLACPGASGKDIRGINEKHSQRSVEARGTRRMKLGEVLQV